MTYFLEFHTPRGIFTSVPQTSVSTASIMQDFENCQYKEAAVAIRVSAADGGKICLTTDMIRQTILVTREAE